jgi:ABC-type glycerol-3-phosphate transport system substrate-binding protein
MKSFVWYSPKTFAANGYTVPTTWDELWALSDQMVADGVKPWCGGLESGGATGWAATDWLEQIMLRMYGGETYDKWVNHELLFDSPEVTAAMDVLAGWMKNPDYVNGGFGNVQTIATTAFQDAGGPILKAECGMLQQASFYANFWTNFQEGATVGPDGDAFAFYLPAIDEGVAPQPVVGGGEFVARLAVEHGVLDENSVAVRHGVTVTGNEHGALSGLGGEGRVKGDRRHAAESTVDRHGVRGRARRGAITVGRSVAAWRTRGERHE